MQKTVELIITHYVAKNGNVRDLSVEQLREIENAAQVDRWEIEAKDADASAVSGRHIESHSIAGDGGGRFVDTRKEERK